MLYSNFIQVFSTLLLRQPPGMGPASGSSGTSGGGGCGSMFAEPNMLLMVAMVAVFYFAAIRPQMKQQKEQDAMRQALAKGSVIRFSSGIRGEVVSVEGDELVVKIADKTNINIKRSAVERIEGQTGNG